MIVSYQGPDTDEKAVLLEGFHTEEDEKPAPKPESK
jgi:hypothetical protein